MMEDIGKTRDKSRKGGRPEQKVKRTYVIKVKCNILERKVIERKAKEGGFALSVYLRTLGVKGTIIMRKPVLTKEFLEYKATLYHTASNLNQIACKINATGELKEDEKKALQRLEQEIKEHLEAVQKTLVV